MPPGAVPYRICGLFLGVIRLKTKNCYLGILAHGVSIGLAFGNFLFEHGTIGMSLGLPVGMLLGMIVGAAKDKQVSQQLEEKGYKITAINVIGQDKYEITVTDKSDNVKEVEVLKGDMEAEQFQIGDFVNIDEDGHMESVMDKE